VVLTYCVVLQQSEGDWVTQLFATERVMLAASNLGLVRAYDFAKQKWKKQVIYKDADKNEIAAMVSLPAFNNELWLACGKKIIRFDNRVRSLTSSDFIEP